jgi:hypothetical protein
MSLELGTFALCLHSHFWANVRPVGLGSIRWPR